MYCIIAFILGWLLSKYMGDGFSVGGPTEPGNCEKSCTGLKFKAGSPHPNEDVCSWASKSCPKEAPYISANTFGCGKASDSWPNHDCCNVTTECKITKAKQSSSNDSSPPSSPVSESKSNSKTNCENISCGGKKFGSGTNNNGIDVSGKSVCPWNVCPNEAPYVNLKGGGCAKNPHDFPDCCNSKKCNADVDYNIPGYCGYNWKYYRRYCKRGQDCFNWFTGDQAGNKPPHGRGPQRKCYVPDPDKDDGYCPDYCYDPDKGIRPH